jgi:hypothetical protein
MNITLNPEQQKSFDAIEELFNPENRFNNQQLLISGYPGTGKTFVPTLALKKLAEIDRSMLSRIAVCAFSHRAKRVIRDYLNDQGLDIDAYTIHSILGLQAEVSEDEGKQNFNNKGKSSIPITQYEYVWVDEVSLVNTELFNNLIGKPVNFLFTGDDKQLLPVNELSFPVFDFFINKPDQHYRLINPERYSGSIKDFVYKCLDDVNKGELSKPENYLAFDDETQFIPDWFTDWCNNDDDKVVLTFTNKAVDKINRKCRDYVMGNVGQFYKNEKLIAYQPIKDEDDNLIINNGDEFYVDTFEDDYLIVGSNKYDVYRIKPIHCNETFIVIKDYELKSWNEFLNLMAKKCKAKKERWSNYYYWKQLSAEVKPHYAMTIHKAQGSGFNHVYVINNFKWLKDESMQPRLHYVAGSRAKKRLIYSNRA